MTTTTHCTKSQPSDYSVSQFATDFTKLAGSRDGAKDIIEAVCNACDWMVHLNFNRGIALATSTTLEPIGRTFSAIGLLEHMNGLRDQLRVSHVKDGEKLKKDVFHHVTLGIAKAADTARLIHDSGIYVFKQGLNSIKTAFWASLGIFDTVGIYTKAGELQEYKAELAEFEGTEAEGILQSRINLTYLQILQSVTLVAMAAISLVSLVFGSMAQGVLFSPVVMLGLSSSWLILNFVNYFYDRIIVHRQNQLVGAGHTLPPSAATAG